ncbi:zinc transporter ZntB [Pseudooceanicola endophyticus]|uniref:zinc transporter ZntB n=1 Tax=Pseudooceanicola endophyticus TaxID=2841273 RepID=UPI001F1E3F66|nr:zinc transporter ZntB [Pseudooceanicola endophyticus]
MPDFETAGDLLRRFPLRQGDVAALDLSGRPPIIAAMTHPIHFAYVLDGPARCQRLAGHDVQDMLLSPTLAWAHLDATHDDAQDWVAAHLSYLDDTVTEALTQTETRPRATAIGEGLLVILRGVNLNPGKDREDMVAVRLWADAHRIVTLSRQRVRALEDIAAEIDAGAGPATAGEFIAMLADRLTDRIEPFVTELDSDVDGLETEIIQSPSKDLRRRIVALRLSVVELRRHMPPQRDALKLLAGSKSPLFSEHDLRELQENHDRLTRVSENLDELRDNLGVLRDELAGLLADRLNSHMYVLAIISGIFLPLGFLTGLFGINVGGMPGAGDPHAFWVFTGLLIALVALVLAILRGFRWL